MFRHASTFPELPDKATPVDLARRIAEATGRRVILMDATGAEVRIVPKSIQRLEDEACIKFLSPPIRPPTN
jgi:hypothetical protein